MRVRTLGYRTQAHLRSVVVGTPVRVGAGLSQAALRHSGSMSAAKGPWPRKLATLRLEQIADVHGIELTWCLSGEPFDAIASQGKRRRPGVRVPRPYSPRLYLIGLHEFGHVICRPSLKLMHEDASAADIIGCEAAAWGWATRNLGPAELRPHLPRAVVSAVTWECLASYVLPAERRRR